MLRSSSSVILCSTRLRFFPRAAAASLVSFSRDVLHLHVVADVQQYQAHTYLLLVDHDTPCAFVREYDT